jgi:hypothetical protein
LVTQSYAVCDEKAKDVEVVDYLDIPNPSLFLGAQREYYYHPFIGKGLGGIE